LQSSSSCNETDAGIAILGWSLAQLQTITQLRLNLNNCVGITSVGLANLIVFVPKLKNISQLALSFYKCVYIKGFETKILSENLTQLKNLNQLTLNFKGCDINDNGNLGDLKTTVLHCEIEC